MSRLADLTIINRWTGKLQDPFIVPTPQPYIIELDHYDDPEQKRARIRQLLTHVQDLREIMAELHINEIEAYNLGLTLNIHTGELLARVAWDQGKNKLAAKLWAERKF